MTRTRILYDFVMKLWPLSKLVFWLGKQPVSGAILHPLFSKRLNQVVILPVNEEINRSQSAVMPYQLLESLVQESSARFILNTCQCRDNDDCQVFPHTIGCLYLGEGAALINPSLGRQVSVEEALLHVRKGLEHNLTPLIAHTIFDAAMLNIPYRRMLTICFCCDCCCVVRYGLRMGPPAFWEVVRRLPGLSVEVGDECIACQECFDSCPTEAISMDTTKAVIGANCKGCGRCVETCPQNAIHMRLEGYKILPETLKGLIRREWGTMVKPEDSGKSSPYG